MLNSRNHFSIKWKLSTALIASGLSLVLIYISIAKNVFESDKISFVYESQNGRLNSLKREIEAKFQQVLFSSKSLLSTLDSNANMPQSAKDLFKDNNLLLGIDLWDEVTNKSLFHIEKQTAVLASSVDPQEKAKPNEVRLFLDKNKNLLFTFRPHQDPKSPLLARVVMNTQGFLPSTEASQALMITQGTELLFSIGTTSYDPALLSELAAQFSPNTQNLNTIKDSVKNPEKNSINTSEKTQRWNFKAKHFLVSTSTLSLGQLTLIAFTPEEQALGALNTLFSRSLVFLLFSTFGLIIISLLIAKRLTADLQILTLAANEIGQGIFDKAPNLKSKDEIGLLAKAFQKMAQEIKRLLQETKDKARMESELKTAKLVQESLFPELSTFNYNEIELNGIAITSTECGGDWWYYFTQDDDLYIAIADATGHGTPAALITAAARSVFARIEKEQISLSAMMRAWDHSIASCSKKQVCMTGILLKINSKTGAGSYIGASHQPPFLFSADITEYVWSELDLLLNPFIGDGFTESGLTEQTFQLDKDCTLVLFTDGLFSVEHPNGSKLSEFRFGRALAKQINKDMSAQAITNLIQESFDAHRMDLPLPDDLTIVSIRRK